MTRIYITSCWSLTKCSNTSYLVSASCPRLFGSTLAEGPFREVTLVIRSGWEISPREPAGPNVSPCTKQRYCFFTSRLANCACRKFAATEFGPPCATIKTPEVGKSSLETDVKCAKSGSTDWTQSLNCSRILSLLRSGALAIAKIPGLQARTFRSQAACCKIWGDMETSKTSPAHILQLPPPESCAEQPCRSSWTQSLHRFRGWSHMHSVGDQPLLQHSFTDLICSERLQRFSCVSWIILDQFLILLTYWLWYVMRVYVFSYDATQLIWYPANLMPRFLLWEYENAGKNWNNQPVACSEACHFSAFTRTRFRLSKQCVEAMPTISGWTSQNTLSATCHAAAFSWSDGSKEQHRISQLDSIRIVSSDIDPKNCKFLTESHLPTQP